MSNVQLESIRARLDKIRDNGPLQDAFADAESFVERLPTPLRFIPHVSLADDGEINFYWNGDGIYVDLGFYGTGSYSYFAIDQRGRKYHGDDVPVGGTVPAALAGILSG